MKTFFTLLFLCALLAQNMFATRPTVHVSNISSQSLHCRSVTLTWTNGNGNARLIIASEGSAPTFVPADKSTYTGNPHFGHSLQYITGNYAVFNADTNVAVIDSLKPGKTYYFTIYEHDNTGSLTAYYTSNAPTFSVTTYGASLDFSITSYDSCQAHNLFRMINKSSSTIPGIQYYFDFYDGDTSMSDNVLHSYKISGLIPVRLRILSDKKGCNQIMTKNVRVYQKKMVFFDFKNLQNTDTVQSFYNNRFKLYTGAYTNPLNASYGYHWFSDLDPEMNRIYSFFDWNFKTEGRRKISLEISANISKGGDIYPTGCKDTLSLYMRVGSDALKTMGVLNGHVQAIDTNNFHFNNTDTSIRSLTWYFGDGDTSTSPSPVHTYTTKDTFHVTAKARDSKGDYHEKTITIVVVSMGINSSVHSSASALYRLYPNPSSGGITIQSALPVDNIAVYNLAGMKIAEYETDAKRTITLDLSGLASGNYMLYIRNGSSTHSEIIQLKN